MPDKTFTNAELSEFDGKKNEKIYVALNFNVYDVTEKGQSHYGKGGQYEVFAGKDISRAMASMQMQAATSYDDLSDLTEAQLKSLQGWQAKYAEKYTVVGRLVK